MGTIANALKKVDSWKNHFSPYQIRKIKEAVRDNKNISVKVWFEITPSDNDDYDYMKVPKGEYKILK